MMRGRMDATDGPCAMNELILGWKVFISAYYNGNVQVCTLSLFSKKVESDWLVSVWKKYPDALKGTRVIQNSLKRNHPWLP